MNFFRKTDTTDTTDTTIWKPGFRELKQPRRQRRQQLHKFTYLTTGIFFARFARAIFIFMHSAAVLILSMT